MTDAGKQPGNDPEAGWLLGTAALILGGVCVLGVVNGGMGVVGGFLLAILSVGCFIAAGIKGSVWWFAVLGAIVLTVLVLFKAAMSHCCMM